MFLPVFLLRDFGPAGFWVFAVPNVVGAALMGVVLARPGASETLVARHGVACWWFSLVTLTFQWFFFFWMVLGLRGGASRWVVIPAAAVILLTGGALKGVGGGRWTRTFSLVVWVASAVLGGLWLAGVWGGGPSDAVVVAKLRESDVVWLAPVVLFGFALCPYLDLTFHQARQRLPGPAGSTAFIIGFGLLFFAMILLTRAYAPGLIAAAARAGVHVHPGLLALPLLAHVTVQLVYTVMLHKAWLDAQPSPTGPRTPGNAALIGLAAGLGLAVLAWNLPGYAGLSAPEVTYRGFMAFYGLVFPAYVWLCVIGRGELSRSAVRVFAAACVVAAPFYWMGFIERKTWWLAPGLGVVLVARMFVGATPRLRGVPESG